MLTCPLGAVAAMIKAFESIEYGYRPKITFLIVQKRNKMRFFPEGQVLGPQFRKPAFYFGQLLKLMYTAYGRGF